jgi:beta-glucanase (GH16 family)
MSFRSLASLRVAASFAVILIVSACSDDRVAQLSGVETIEVPTADAGAQQNQNIANPTLEIPVTYPVEDGDELTLVWSDEFDGPEIDPATWFFATGDGTEAGLPGGWGNNELQYYLPDNAMIVNGVLEITARQETIGGLNYTSARINTQDRFAFKYGRIEASIKLPSGQGLWPAFWLFPQDNDYLCSGEPCLWAAVGEIDIVEAVNLDGTGGNEIFSTIHYGGELPANQSTETRFTPSVDVTEDFHTYALEWDEEEIRWYFDGELYAVANSWFTDADGQEYPAPFNQNFYILLNMAVGGNFPGSPDGTTPWPVTMEVDWVRVYSGEPPPADPGDVPENAVFVTDPNITADLAAPMLDNFGSGAAFNQFYAGDPDFKPTLQVTSGEGYGAGVHVGFVAFAGYDAGFAADYETLTFKVKGLPGDELEIKFFGSPETAIIINLGTYAGAQDLGNGWYQVTIPMSDFAANVYAFTGFLIGPPGDQSAPFSFLLTDIGFDGAIVTTPADAGTTPDVTLYARGGATDLVPGEVSVFGSGSLPNGNNTGDVDFSPAFSVTTGNGYTVQVGQLAFLGFGAGFAANYETLDFKVKGMNNNIIRLKLLEAAPSDYVDITLTTSEFATWLGNGWYQVSVPLANFGNAATADSLLFETGGEPPADAFTFLLNDIGFSGMVDVGGGDDEITIGVFSETHTDPVIALGAFINSIDFGGNNTVATPIAASALTNGVTAFDGTDVLEIDYQNTGGAFGGALFNFQGADISAYTTLKFSINTSQIPGFANLTIQIEPPGGPQPGNNVALSAYAPVATAGDWSTYEIPLADFPGSDLTAVGVVGFWNARDGGDVLVYGQLYLDDVHLSAPPPADDSVTIGVFSETHTDPVIALGAFINSIDFGGNNTVATPIAASALTNGVTAFDGTDVLEIDYQNTGGAFGGALFNFQGADISAYTTLKFSINTSQIPGFANLTIQIEPPGGPQPGNNIALSAYAPVATAGDWSTYEIPLADFPGSDLTAVGVVGFWNARDGGDALVYGQLYLDDVHLSAPGNGGGGNGGGAEGNIAINGGFETGAFNDGSENASWQQFPGGGTQAIVTDNPSEGTYAANLVIPVRGPGDPGVDNLIKNANLQAGSLTPNAPVTVTWDLRGSLAGAGGVVFVELFSELDGGGTSKAEIYTGGPIFPDADPNVWTPYSWNTTLGPDVSGGVTLQLKVGCGGVEGCGADIFFDNVTVTIN